MVKVAKPGKSVGSYTVQRILNKGAMAIAYEATNGSGQKVFLKQYKSPSPTTEWYNSYVKYQAKMKRQIEGTRFKHYSYELIEFFEAKFGPPTYFQVFEFVDKGHDLRTTMDEIQSHPTKWPFLQRLTLAKVLMAGIAALHDAQIVHCDLKPENIQLFTDPSIKTGYQLKIIDMDYSILEGQKAPWHDHQPYVGTPDYMSPEHLEDGGIPLPQSDVFTCGLILYELLGQGNPYICDTPEDYRNAVREHSAKRPEFDGETPDNEMVSELIHRCLSPDPYERPTAKEVNQGLKGKSAPVRTSTHESSKPPKRKPPKRKIVEEKNTSPEVLQLVGETGDPIIVRINRSIGRSEVKQIGEDAKYWDHLQFQLSREKNGWHIIPNIDSPNQTLINGKAITDSTKLAHEDVVSVGREAKGISKLPLTVRCM